jgi:uncharacterized protein YdaU (DUF1376 family)
LVVPTPTTKDINMHFFEWNIGEYAKKTQHLTNEEDLAYRRALEMYYDSEKPLPTDGLATLSRRLRVDQQALQNVLSEFFPGGVNKHAEEKIAAYYAYITKQSTNGKLGGRPKRTQAKPTDNPKEPSAKPLLTTNQELLTNKIHTHLSMLLDVGVENQIAKDWLSIRKIKRLPLTQTSFESISKKITAAGLTMNAGIKICVEQGWAGFSADWLTTVPELKLSGPHVNWYDTEEATHERARREGVEIIDDLRLLRVRLNDVIQSKRK